MDYNPEEIMLSAIRDGIVETEDGCIVEPDGSCPHGCQSPLILMGLI